LPDIQVGTIVSLDDPRFSAEHGRFGMWEPVEFMFTVGAGIYFLEECDASRTPILFVRGIGGYPTEFKYLVGKLDRRLRGAGFRTLNLDYPSRHHPLQDIVEHVRRAAAVFIAGDAAPVHFVTHSMGGLSTRYYIKNLGGESKVEDWVSLGGPNHGTETANLCFEVSCEEMRINSKFLKELNAGDETPGAVHYATWWSPCDEFINPDSSVPLSGATNTETACISHLSLLTDETVYKQVREFIK